MIFVKNGQAVGNFDRLCRIRRDNQNVFAAAALVGIVAADDVNQRKDVGHGFAAAGRCNRKNVLALQN